MKTRFCLLPMLALWLLSCSWPTRAQVRSGLLMSARALLTANEICADVSRIMRRSDDEGGKKLARSCTKITYAAFDTLEAGEKALDASQETKALCAVSHGFDALKSILDAAKVTFGSDAVPKVLSDAVAVAGPLAALVAGKCEAP